MCAAKFSAKEYDNGGTGGLTSTEELHATRPASSELHARCSNTKPPRQGGRVPDVSIPSQRESSPGGSLRQQTKPFIIEKKPSRKPKTGSSKPSIWGKLDLSLRPETKMTAAGGDDRR